MYSTQLKRALLEKELTAAKLAEITGLSRASISQYLAGKKHAKGGDKATHSRRVRLSVGIF